MMTNEMFDSGYICVILYSQVD